MHDLVANDTEAQKESVEGLGGSLIGPSARPVLDGVTQGLRGLARASAEAAVPIVGTLHAPVLPPSLPERRMRLPKFENSGDVNQVLTQYLGQPASVVPSHPVMERAALHGVRGAGI